MGLKPIYLVVTDDKCPSCGEELDVRPIISGGECYACDKCGMAWPKKPDIGIDLTHGFPSLHICTKCGGVKKRHVMNSGKVVYNCDNCQGPVGTEGV